MSETRDDLREALARELARCGGWEDPGVLWTDNVGQISRGFQGYPVWQEYAEEAAALIRGPLAPILTQVSVLQAERDQIAEAFLRVAEAIGAPASERLDLEVRDRFSVLQAEVERLQKEGELLSRALQVRLAQVRGREITKLRERLQKVEGERGRLERDPKGSGFRPADQAPAGLAPLGFDPSRDDRIAAEAAMMSCELSHGACACEKNKHDPSSVGSVLCATRWRSARIAIRAVRASDEHPAGEDPKGLRAKPASAIANGDAPETHPTLAGREGGDLG